MYNTEYATRSLNRSAHNYYGALQTRVRGKGLNDTHLKWNQWLQRSHSIMFGEFQPQA